MAPSDVAITMSTASQVIQTAPPAPPEITLNGEPLPALANPGYSSGFPATSCVIGRSQIGYGQATEQFDFPASPATVGNV